MPSDDLQRSPTAKFPGIGWLAEIQKRAMEDFSSRGFPTTAEENWRYTDLSQAARRAGTLASVAPRSASPALDKALLERFAHPCDHTMAVFVDGAFRPDLSHFSAIPALSVHPLSQAGEHARTAIAGRLGRTVTADDSSLASLNTALLRDGLRVEIAPDVTIAEPIYVVFGSTNDGTTQNRLLVEIGAGSKAILIEHHVSLAASLTNSVTDVVCHPGSRLTYTKLQHESDTAIHLASQEFSVDSGAHADLLHLDLGALLGRNDLKVDLSGRGAKVEANGLFFADQSRHIDNHTHIDHRAPESTSRELYRGIVDGKGRGVFNGKVVVHPGADKADARLTNQNLLLSRTAELDTKPELEIYADDVKCSHGATTGQLDANAIFYLRSRGIPAEQARRMLIASFAREIARRVTTPALDSHVLALLQERLPEVREFARLP